MMNKGIQDLGQNMQLIEAALLFVDAIASLHNVSLPEKIISLLKLTSWQWDHDIQPAKASYQPEYLTKYSI